MGTIVKPYTLLAGGTVSHTELNALFDTVYNEFNGNITDANIKSGANINGSKLAAASITGAKLASASISESKLDYTSVRVLRSGPSTPGANGVRSARGGKAFTLVAGTATITITFSSDSDDGNPAFSAAPRIYCTVETATGTNLYYTRITARSSTGCTIVIQSNAADTPSGTLHWEAIGDV